MTNVFQIDARDPGSAARAGRLQTAHGVIETPVFMPVGTQGTVKCMTPDELRQVEMSAPFLPEDKPRYVMGVGTPPQMLEMIARGVDMFDCVLPTRAGRNGHIFTQTGSYAIKNAAYREDFGPLEQGCECYACRQFSRAYLRHLFWANEILGLRLMTWHNLHMFLGLLRRARAAIVGGNFGEFRREVLARYEHEEMTKD